VRASARSEFLEEVHMEDPRPEKVAVVTEVKERLGRADAALLTEYRGLNVAAMAELRRALRAAGGDYKIYKNTLARLGARSAGIDTLDEMLTGPTAIAFVEGDAAAVAKALRDYARVNPALVVKGGLLGQRVLTANEVTALADLPSREVILAQLAGALQAPIAQFASLLAALPRNFAYGLKALIDQQGGAPAEEPSGEAAQEDSGAPAEASVEAEADEAPAAAPEPEAPVAEVETPEPTVDEPATEETE
jgi:large subunit ribosomal protein L10